MRKERALNVPVAPKKSAVAIGAVAAALLLAGPGYQAKKKKEGQKKPCPKK